MNNSGAEQLSAVVITYHPSSEQVAGFTALLALFESLIVVDNTPASDAARNALDLISDDPQITVIRNRANVGIAAAMNIGVRLAQQRGCRWVVTLDQDSRPTSQLTRFFFRVMRGEFPLGNIGVVGANYINTNNGRLGMTRTDTNHEYAIVRCVISSGSLLNLSCFEAIGGFDERLFIDMVDTEYCYRARQNGYCVALSTEPLMEHAVGYVRRLRFLGQEYLFTLHPPFRQYYIFRNSIYVVRKYCRFEFWGCMKLISVYLPVVLFKSMLISDRKRENLQQIVKGLGDGLWRFPKNSEV